MEDFHKRPVDKITKEEFIATSDRCRKVAESKGCRMVLGVPPAMRAGNDNSNHVQSECNREVLEVYILAGTGRSIDHDTYNAVGVVPNTESDPETWGLEPSVLLPFLESRDQVASQGFLIVL